MSLCTERSVVNEGPSQGAVATLRCKRWSCPDCAPNNRKKVVAKARDGNPTVFMTLTWNASRPETPDQAARLLKNAWVNLRRRIDRTYGQKRIPFICVFEKTKRGFPHMHILMRADFIPQQWLSDAMRALIDAPIVDIRLIKSRKMAFFYVTKYLGKDLAPFEGCKRWWRSHNYEIEKEPEYVPFLYGSGFQVVEVNWHILKRRYLAGGFDLENERDGYFEFRRRSPGGFDPTYGGRLAVASPVPKPLGFGRWWLCNG